MDAQRLLRQFLLRSLDERKLSSPKYSLRMFAGELDVPVGALSSFIKGKRRFSKKMSLKVARNLGLSQNEIYQIENTFTSVTSEQLEKQQLDCDLYYLLADPAYYSFLCLIETADFQDNTQWISKRLSISKKQVEDIKDKLLEIGMIHYDGEKLTPIESVLASSDNIPNQSLRVRHQRNMEDAKSAINEFDVNKRYFAFETLAFDEADLVIAQRKINQLLDDLILLSNRGVNKTEVYEFCTQYFPRSK